MSKYKVMKVRTIIAAIGLMMVGVLAYGQRPIALPDTLLSKVSDATTIEESQNPIVIDTIPTSAAMSAGSQYIIKNNLTGISVNYQVQAEAQLVKVDQLMKLVKSTAETINAYDYGTYNLQSVFNYGPGGLDSFILADFKKTNTGVNNYVILYRVQDQATGNQRTRTIVNLKGDISPCLDLAKINGDINQFASELFDRYGSQIAIIQVEILKYLEYQIGKLGCCPAYLEQNRGKGLNRELNPSCDAQDPLDNLDDLGLSDLILTAMYCNNQPNVNLPFSIKISVKNLPKFDKNKNNYVFSFITGGTYFRVFKVSNNDSITLRELTFNALGDPIEGDYYEFRDIWGNAKSEKMYIHYFPSGISPDFVIYSTVNLKSNTQFISKLADNNLFESLKYKKEAFNNEELALLKKRYHGCFWKDLCQDIMASKSV